MKNVLDKLAEAICASCWRLKPRVVVARVELRHQFGLPITPTRWQALDVQLACSLSPLEKAAGGLWRFPRNCNTIWDLAALVANQHPDWKSTSRNEADEWREAQIFVRVSACLVEALNVDSEKVTRTARLQADLGAE
jgi:hypothetical protein